MMAQRAGPDAKNATFSRDTERGTSHGFAMRKQKVYRAPALLCGLAPPVSMGSPSNTRSVMVGIPARCSHLPRSKPVVVPTTALSVEKKHSSALSGLSAMTFASASNMG